MKALTIGGESLTRNGLIYSLDEVGGSEEINEAESVREASEALLISQYNIIFLGVSLMDEDDIELGAKIQKIKEPPAVIFATTYNQHTVQAFGLNATDYTLKPFGRGRTERTVNKVRATKTKDDNSANAIVNDMPANFDQSLPVKIDDKIHILKQQNTIGIGTHNGITTVHTTNHKYETTEPLNRYEKRLNPTYFIRIHRLYIINTKHIKKVQQWLNCIYMVTLTNGVKMQVGRSFMKDFKASIGLP